MKIRPGIFAIAVALFFSLSGSASAEPGGRMGRVLEQLNLTSEQQQQIDNIREQRKASSENLREQFQAAREEMRSLQASNASAAQLRQQRQEMEQIKEQLEDQRFEAMLEIREILTPEQRAQLAEIRPEGQRQGRGFRGNRSAR